MPGITSLPVPPNDMAANQRMTALITTFRSEYSSLQALNLNEAERKERLNKMLADQISRAYDILDMCDDNFQREVTEKMSAASEAGSTLINDTTFLADLLQRTQAFLDDTRPAEDQHQWLLVRDVQELYGFEVDVDAFLAQMGARMNNHDRWTETARILQKDITVELLLMQRTADLHGGAAAQNLMTQAEITADGRAFAWEHFRDYERKIERARVKIHSPDVLSHDARAREAVENMYGHLIAMSYRMDKAFWDYGPESSFMGRVRLFIESMNDYNDEDDEDDEEEDEEDEDDEEDDEDDDASDISEDFDDDYRNALDDEEEALTALEESELAQAIEASRAEAEAATAARTAKMPNRVKWCMSGHLPMVLPALTPVDDGLTPFEAADPAANSTNLMRDIKSWLGDPQLSTKPLVKCVTCLDELRVDGFPRTGRETEDGYVLGCGHIVGVACLYAHIWTKTQEADHVSQRPACPICRERIRLDDRNKVKEHVTKALETMKPSDLKEMEKDDAPEEDNMARSVVDLTGEDSAEGAGESGGSGEAAVVRAVAYQVVNDVKDTDDLFADEPSEFRESYDDEMDLY